MYDIPNTKKAVYERDKRLFICASMHMNEQKNKLFIRSVAVV